MRAENIVKRFGALTALDGVTLRPRKGEVLGLIGDNGAGKSTLIKIITGYHRPDRGAIYRRAGGPASGLSSRHGPSESRLSFRISHSLTS